MTKIFELTSNAVIEPPAEMFRVSEDGWISIETMSGQKDLEVFRGVWYPVYVKKVIKMKKKLSWRNFLKKQKALGVIL